MCPPSAPSSDFSEQRLFLPALSDAVPAASLSAVQAGRSEASLSAVQADRSGASLSAVQAGRSGASLSAVQAGCSEVRISADAHPSAEENLYSAQDLRDSPDDLSEVFPEPGGSDGSDKPLPVHRLYSSARDSARSGY